MKRQIWIALLVGFTLSVTASATMVHQDWLDQPMTSRQAIIDFLQDLVDPVPVPDVEEIIDEARFEDPGGKSDYVAKFYGWVTVPETGTYQFHYSCDDNGMLYVSQDEEMANATQVAYVDGWCAAALWDKYPSQHSEPMQLQAGQIMAVMAFFEEQGGGDNMDIGWTGPGLSQDITAPTYLTDYITHIPPTPTIAKNVGPADEAVDVPRDTVLIWSPGKLAAAHDVYFGTVLADVNDASRDNPLGVLVSEGQVGTTYDPPDLLEYGLTYYWRVDEVNAPPDSTIFKGKIWSFVAEPLYYPVADVNATTSLPTSEGAGDIGVTVDGSGLTNGQHGVLDPDMWLGLGTPGEPAWIQYDFDRVYKLYGIHVWNYNGLYEVFLGFGLKDITIEYATEPNEWTPLGDFQLDRATSRTTYAGQVIDLDGLAAKSVRITINSSQTGGPQYGLSEIQFLQKAVFAREPNPADGAIEVSRDASLSWRVGREATSHQVHFGTDSNAVADGEMLVDTVAVATYDPGALDLGATYYWMIGEVNDAESPSVWDSAVWSFTTQEYVDIDNFESYTDDEGTRIFDVWLDGYGVTNNGSLVGHENPPYAEMSVAHSGQAMPLYYSNTAGVANSEAELAFTPAQDWTANGADTLSVYYRGNPTGFYQVAEDNIIMNGTGTDIWGTTDEFRFVYKQLTGNGSIIARVEYLDYTNEWAKAGLMVRETLDSDSVLVDAVVSASRRVSSQYRSARAVDMGSPASDTNTVIESFEFPYWLKLTRTGDVFTIKVSTDGVTWTDPVPETTTNTSFTITQAMPQTVYIGLAVCSHATGLVAGSQFTGIATTGNVTGAWQSASVGLDQPAGNGIDTFYLTVEDTSGQKVTLTNPSAAAVAAGVYQQWAIPLSDITAAGVKANSVKKLYLGVGDKTQPSKNASGILYIDDIAFGNPIE